MFSFRVCFYSVVYLIRRKVNPDYLNMTLINRKLMETNGLTMPTFFLICDHIGCNAIVMFIIY